MNKNMIKNTLIDAQNALDEFAAAPSSRMDDYPCHKGLTDIWNCGRCSRAIHAYGASRAIDYALAELEIDNE